jgi:hypothetical protein
MLGKRAWPSNHDSDSLQQGVSPSQTLELKVEIERQLVIDVTGNNKSKSENNSSSKYVTPIISLNNQT